MKKSRSFSSIHAEASDVTTHYASFILRCWQDGEGQVRARLVDINAGVSYPIAYLSELPAILERLLQSVFVPSEDSNHYSISKKG